MDNEEIIEQQNAYYMAGYPSRRSERKMDNHELKKEIKTEVVISKDNSNIEQFKFCSSESSIVKQMLTKFTEEQQKGHTEIEIDGVRFSNISEMLQYMNKQREQIADLESQIEQLQKINNDQKETLKKVRVALIQERAAIIMNYGKGGVEMFDNIFNIISKSVSN